MVTLYAPGIPQHVIQRGNKRQVYFGSDEDFAAYAQCWRSTPVSSSWDALKDIRNSANQGMALGSELSKRRSRLSLDGAYAP